MNFAHVKKDKPIENKSDVDMIQGITNKGLIHFKGFTKKGSDRERLTIKRFKHKMVYNERFKQGHTQSKQRFRIKVSSLKI